MSGFHNTRNNTRKEKKVVQNFTFLEKRNFVILCSWIWISFFFMSRMINDLIFLSLLFFVLLLSFSLSLSLIFFNIVVVFIFFCAIEFSRPLSEKKNFSLTAFLATKWKLTCILLFLLCVGTFEMIFRLSC